MTETLPFICGEGNHRFIPRDNIVTPTCGCFEGADVYQEAIVIISQPKKYSPRDGDVCQNCFQIYGASDSAKDMILLKLYSDLTSWEKGR